MCGSGTFLIEAATLVAGKAPGAGRAFAFEAFPDHDPAAWAALRARGAERFEPSRFIGRDIDPRAIDAAAHNAKRAGVSLDLAIADLAELTPPEGPPGVILTNPPYGRRLARGEAKRLAVTLGATLRARFAGWGVAVVAPAGLANATGLPLRKALAFDNGGLDVAVMVGALPR
jgi:putative N6-adenine-specific DNA methylase